MKNKIKIGVILIIANCFLSQSFCQTVTPLDSILTTTWNFNINDFKLTQTIQNLSSLTGYSFSYNTELLKNDSPLKKNYKNESLNTILSDIFNDSTLKFSVIQKQIIISNALYDSLEENTIDSTKLLHISGKIIDKFSNTPLPYASITIPGQPFGTLSNGDGEFLIRIPHEFLKDTLFISCLGYKNYIAPVSGLLNNENIFILDYEFVAIGEIIIRRNDPMELIKNCISKFPENYPNKPTYLTSFYRETTNKNQQLIEVNEALLKIYKGDYSKIIDGDQIKIVKGRKMNFMVEPDSIALKLKSGLNTALLIDVVKNPIDFFDLETLNQYQFTLKDIILENQKELYAISFEPKPYSTQAIFQGILFLEIKSLALRTVEFNIQPAKISSSSDRYILKKPRNLNVKLDQANYRVSYKEINGKNYLAHVTYTTTFKIKKKSKLFYNSYQTATELVSTDLDTVDVIKFRAQEIVKSNDIFSEQHFIYDEHFWGNYNYLKPEESLIKALDLQTAFIDNDH